MSKKKKPGIVSYCAAMSFLIFLFACLVEWVVFDLSGSRAAGSVAAVIVMLVGAVVATWKAPPR